MTDRVPENSHSWYNLIFSNLPDECLEFEKNSNLAQLTPEMVDQYKAMFEVITHNKNILNYELTNLINDAFQIFLYLKEKKIESF